MAAINYTALASGALGFTLALAWNDAVVKTVRAAFPLKKDKEMAAGAALLYAVLVTLLIVAIVYAANHARHLALLVQGPPRASAPNGAEVHPESLVPVRQPAPGDAPLITILGHGMNLG